MQQRITMLLTHSNISNYSNRKKMNLIITQYQVQHCIKVGCLPLIFRVSDFAELHEKFVEEF